MQKEAREYYEKRLKEEKAKLEENLFSLSVPLGYEYKWVNSGNFEPNQRVPDDACCAILRGLLDQVNKALDIIETHPEKYGICEACGKFIPEDRIDALPWATICAKCAEKMPKREFKSPNRSLPIYRPINNPKCVTLIFD